MKFPTQTLTTLVLVALANFSANADQKISDDLIVKGSLCVGIDCNDGEAFTFDTIRLRENNLRIKFIDSSATGSFPTRDWQITVNDSTNGGANWFGIEDVDTNTIPFKILSGAPTNSIYIIPNGNVGFGTNAPLVDVVVKSGNSPTLRLEQDGTAGFAEQIWDVGGNEANFFVRDVSNGSALPLRIMPNAPNGSIHVAADGDIGFETTTPDGQFDVAHSSDANNHAFLISPVSYVGVNIDNGFLPNGLFEIQDTGGVSRFMVHMNGRVGVGTKAPTGRFDVVGTDGTTPYFNVGATGNVAIGSISSTALFDIQKSATSLFSVQSDGQTALVSSYFDTDATPCGGNNSTISLACGRYKPIMTIEESNTSVTQGRLLFQLKNNGPSWFGFEDTTTNKLWYMGNTQDNFTIALFDKTAGEITVPMLVTTGGDMTISGNLSQGSNRDSKENIQQVDPDLILSTLEKLEISTWSYKKDENATTHIGPMAQDFYNLFNVGVDEKHISSLDTNGVSLAAIQSLYKKVKQLEAKLAAIEKK